MASTSRLILNRSGISILSIQTISATRINSRSKHYHTLRTLTLPTFSLISKGHLIKIITPSATLKTSSIILRNLTCWKCETKLDEKSEYSLLVCSKCQSLQELRGRNIPDYYELLGHPKTYRVDVNSLSSRVKNLQKKLHPDLYTQKGKHEQELSQELSSLVNKAFGTLSHPIERGRYLLKLHGVDDPEGDSEKELTNNPEFLEEVMDLNEQLVEISSEKDWMNFRQQNDISLNELAIKLEDAFEKEKIKDAIILIGRMKYYDTLNGKLQEVKSRLGIVE